MTCRAGSTRILFKLNWYQSLYSAYSSRRMTWRVEVICGLLLFVPFSSVGLNLYTIYIILFRPQTCSLGTSYEDLTRADTDVEGSTVAFKIVSVICERWSIHARDMIPEELSWTYTISVLGFASSESYSFWRFRFASWLLLCDDSSAYKRRQNQWAVSKKPGSYSKRKFEISGG